MVEDPGKRESRYKTHAEKGNQRQRNHEQERGKLIKFRMSGQGRLGSCNCNPQEIG